MLFSKATKVFFTLFANETIKYHGIWEVMLKKYVLFNCECLYQHFKSSFQSTVHPSENNLIGLYFQAHFQEPLSLEIFKNCPDAILCPAL